MSERSSVLRRHSLAHHELRKEKVPFLSENLPFDSRNLSLAFTFFPWEDFRPSSEFHFSNQRSLLKRVKDREKTRHIDQVKVKVAVKGKRNAHKNMTFYTLKQFLMRCTILLTLIMPQKNNFESDILIFYQLSIILVKVGLS